MPPHRSSESSSGGSPWKFADMAFKGLSVIVIPLVLWGVKLEVNNAIQDERISDIQQDLDKLSDVTNSVQSNALALVRMEGKIDNVNEKIDEVKKLLRNQ
jgi:peptidoglycan hydrolase CwlO-like protein